MSNNVAIVESSGVFKWKAREYKCSLGRAGISEKTKEGDDTTPVGEFTLRKLLYRSDRLPNLQTNLPTQPIEPDDGWCDDPNDPQYNKYIKLPYPASAENLLRDDHVYDLVIPISFNDDPVIQGRGSAIFIHIAREGYPPTRGCVALSKQDLLEFLREADHETIIHIRR